MEFESRSLYTMCCCEGDKVTHDSKKLEAVTEQDAIAEAQKKWLEFKTRWPWVTDPKVVYKINL